MSGSTSDEVTRDRRSANVCDLVVRNPPRHSPLATRYPLKYLDEYRNAEAVQRLAAAIRAAVTRPWNIMEICGGQTHAIIRFALDEMLPRGDHPDPRAGLPGVRHAHRDHRPGRGHRRAGRK